MILYKLKRTVTKQECPWLKRDFQQGETVRKYPGVVYGVISENGIPCMHESMEEFFELPKDALELIEKE